MNRCLSLALFKGKANMKRDSEITSQILPQNSPKAQEPHSQTCHSVITLLTNLCHSSVAVMECPNKRELWGEKCLFRMIRSVV